MKFDSNSVIRPNFLIHILICIYGVALYNVSQVTSGPDKCLVKQQSFHYPELAKANKSWIKDQQKMIHMYAHIIHQKEENYR